MLPSVSDLFPQSLDIVLVEVSDRFKAGRILGHQGAFLKDREDIGSQPFVLVKLSDNLEELIPWNILEGVANLGSGVRGQPRSLIMVSFDLVIA